MPDGHKLDQMAIKYTNIFNHNALQNLHNFGIFDLKTDHLAIQVMSW
jgi:hypothetical protein